MGAELKNKPTAYLEGRLSTSILNLHIVFPSLLCSLLVSTIFFASIIVIPLQLMAADHETDYWQQMRQGEVFAIMRHALAPGTGDPADFTLGDCTTQRNLSETGRKQAVAIGKLFQDNGIIQAGVYSSQWCRCLETAELLNLGEVEELPALNSFFREFERREPQTEELKQWLSSQVTSVPLILVTHQVNITALTGLFPASGEIFLIKKSPLGEIQIAQRILLNSSDD